MHPRHADVGPGFPVRQADDGQHACPRLEKDVAKALKTNEALQKKLDAAEAKAAQLAEDVENAKKSASALTEQA